MSISNIFLFNGSWKELVLVVKSPFELNDFLKGFWKEVLIENTRTVHVLNEVLRWKPIENRSRKYFLIYHDISEVDIYCYLSTSTHHSINNLLVFECHYHGVKSFLSEYFYLYFKQDFKDIFLHIKFFILFHGLHFFL